MKTSVPIASLPEELRELTLRAFKDLPYADASLLPEDSELVEVHLLGIAESGNRCIVSCFIYFGDFGMCRCGDVVLDVVPGSRTVH